MFDQDANQTYENEKVNEMGDQLVPCVLQLSQDVVVSLLIVESDTILVDSSAIGKRRY